MSREKNVARFLKYVNKTPTCWLWTGTFYTHLGKVTYGQSWLDGHRTSAHRVSYMLFVGPIPDGLDILHNCDVKACVNPEHIRPGTHQENIAEAFAKLPPGYFACENNGNARLNWDDIHAIRASRAAGSTQAAIAREYGVTESHISQILVGKKWPESKCPVHGTASSEVAA
jgi:hypothetical protein